MKQISFLSILLMLGLSSVFAQNHTLYYVRHKALHAKEYDKSKVLGSPYTVLNQSEAANRLGDSIQLYTTEEGTYVHKLRFKNGKEEVFDGYETGINSYYPQLDLIVLGDCNADYTYNMKTGEWLDYRGNPQYDLFSPSGKYRITRATGDFDRFFIFEKINNEYELLGTLVFHTHSWLMKGMYWESDTELRFLAKRGEYWIPYAGKITTEKPKEY